MKEKNTTRGKSLAWIILLIMAFVVLIAAGVIAVRITAESSSAVLREHDSHLYDLVNTVDRNVARGLSECIDGLENVVRLEMSVAEREALASDDTEPLKRALASSSLFSSCPDIASVLAARDGEFVASAKGDEPERYRVENEDATGCCRIYCDGTGTYSFAVSVQGNDARMRYYALIDTESFLRKVVVDSVYDEYWIVLYDRKNGIAIQNDIEDSACFLLETEEAMKQNDGYSYMVECENNNETGYMTYRYGDRDFRVRIFVVPFFVSQNSIFTVAVGINYDTIVEPISRFYLYGFVATVMLAVALGTFISLALYAGKKERRLSDEISTLAEEKKLTEELLRKQEELAHHQKMETIGIMTAGIAHEFNNLLSPIMANSLLALEKLSSDDRETYGGLVEVYQAASRAKKLVSRISGLSRKSPVGQMVPLSPAEVFASTLTVASASVPENVSVRKEISTARLFLGDEGQIGNMFLNLVLNAVQAMGEKGGVLTLSASDDGENILMSVSDTGTGIPEDKLEKIFEPFYTTKETGKGTGLGLSICMQTASTHGGTLKAENLPEGGARFTFTISAYKQKNKKSDE